MSLGSPSPFLIRITIFASWQLSGIYFVFSILLKAFVVWVRTICPPSFIISLVIPSIPWVLCLFILFMALSISSSVKLVLLLCCVLISLCFSVLALFGCRVTCRKLRIFLQFHLCLMWFLQILSSCSLSFVYFFVCWSFLDPFVFLMFPILIPFFSSVLLFFVSLSLICWVLHIVGLFCERFKDTLDANIQNGTLAEDSTGKWDQFKNVVNETAKPALVLKQRIHQNWFDDNDEQITQLLRKKKHRLRRLAERP